MQFPPQGHRPAPSWRPDNVKGYQTTQRFKRERSLTGTAREAYAIEHYRSTWRVMTRPLLIVGALALIVVVVKQAGVLL